VATNLLSADDEGVMAEINMTPLVDVMLVLLIIFMITMPVLAQKIQVALPEASAAEAISDDTPVSIQVTARGELLWEEDVVTADELSLRLQQAVVANPEVTVHLGADKAVAYGEVMTVMDQVRAAGVTSLGFVTAPASNP